MSINLDGNILYYKTNSDKYIITYTSPYNENLNIILDNLFNTIFPYYSLSNKSGDPLLQYVVMCGPNARFICNLLKDSEGIISGKIIIINWITPQNIEVIKTIESVYGFVHNTIGASYHALVYLEINIDNIIYYIAIETVKFIPYKLQFFIGNSKEDLEKIIKLCYQCIDFYINFECNKSWMEIAYTGGKSGKVKIKSTKSGKV